MRRNLCYGCSFKENQGGPKEGGLNIGQSEGLSMQGTESKTRSNQLLPTTLSPWEPGSSLEILLQYSYEQLIRLAGTRLAQNTLKKWRKVIKLFAKVI